MNVGRQRILFGILWSTSHSTREDYAELWDYVELWDSKRYFIISLL